MSKGNRRRTVRGFKLAGALCLAFLLAGHPRAEESELVAWQEHDPGLGLAKEKGLPIGIYFFDKACRPCELLEKRVLSDPEVAAYLNSHLVPIKIQLSEQKELAGRYKAVGTPTFLFLTPEAQPIDRLLGYVPPDKFLRILHYIGEGVYKTLSYREYEKQLEEKK